MNPLTLLNSLPGALAQGLIWGIMAIGVAITYKILDYADLTVDNSLCTGGAVAAVCIIGGMNPLLALLCAVLAGALAGLCTGLLHTVLGIPAILSGILTQLGCAIRATGNNEHMARAQGISTNRMKVLGLMISNGLVGLSGALLAQYQGNSDINMGRGAIVIGLAAVVIGKALLGKRKNFALRLLTTALGAVAYYFILAIVIWAGLSTTDLKLFSALVVTVFLAIPYLRKKWSARHHAKGGSAVC